MGDQQRTKPVDVDAAIGESLVEAAVGTTELRFQAQRRGRVDRARGAQLRVAELEQGVTPTGQTSVEARPERLERLMAHSRQYGYCLLLDRG